MNTLMYIIIGLNVLIMLFLGFEYYKITRKKYYALILNKNGEIVKEVNINPSYNEFEYEYKKKSYSHIIPEDISFIKFKRSRLILYEFEKPEPINPIKNFESRMYSSVFNELLQMRKIKALNEPKTSIFDKIDKKWLFGGVVILILIIVLLRGGV